ncbi:MAG: flippase-like domain-containing protein [Ignavibacteriales bacterium]|nr:flippase-like domain-containing protein [Ignavibacteriales bacterium]
MNKKSEEVSTSNPISKSGSKYKLFFKIILTIAILYFIINYVSPNEIIEKLLNADLIYVLFVLLLMPINILMQFLKWKIMCNSMLNIYDDSKILKSLFIGFSAGLVTPIRVGEYFGRKMVFENIGIFKVTIATLSEKLTLLITILIICGITAVFFISNYYSLIYASPIIILIVFLFIGAILLIKKYKAVVSFLAKYEEKYNFVKTLILELRYIKNISKKSVYLLFLYSFFLLLVITIQYAFLALAFEPNGNFLLFLEAGLLIVFIKTFLSFLSFADLGVRESSSVFLLEKFGYSSAVGFNSAIFLFLFNLLLPAIIGLFMMFRTDKK